MTNVNIIFQQAVQLHQSGNLQAAHGMYVDILKLEPNHYEAIHLLGVIANQTGNFKNGIQLISRAIALYPYNHFFHSNLGNAYKQANQLRAAVGAYDKAIALKPDFVDAYVNRGAAQKELKEFKAALLSYDKAISLQPSNPLAHFNRGNALMEMGDLDLAIVSYDAAIGLNSNFAEAFLSRGKAQHQLNLPDAATASFEAALRVNPQNAEAHFSLGNAFLAAAKFDAAIESYSKAIAAKPDYAEALCNLGTAFKMKGQLSPALDCYEKAILVKPDYAKAFFNKAVVLQELKQLEAAVDAFNRTILLQPDYPDAHANLGVALLDLGWAALAVQSFDKANELSPTNANVLANRGNAFKALKQFDLAIESYERSIALKPNQDYLLGTLVNTKMQICDWANISNDIEELVRQLKQGRKVSHPFALVAIIDSLAVQKQAAELWVKEMFPSSDALGSVQKHTNHQRVKIGYYSADFHNHATSYLMAGLFEAHDRSKFELIAFSYGPDVEDEMRLRISTAFDSFFDVRARTDEDVARLSRELEIDIAVDLKGFTNEARTGIFALRCAPVQVNYLGFPGTMGAKFIDYLIADTTVVPLAYQQHYVESVAYLPFSYQVNDSRRAISEASCSRADFGLPEAGFVFCCFNNSYKITPSTFDGWMRILQRTEGSVLWLLEDNALASNNLRKEAVQRGVAAHRLIFAQRVALPEHLARQQLADLFIDSFPCNAHTTASDALWAGLPVLTLMGESFSSRVAASLLSAVNLTELIATEQEEFEALAISLATNPGALSALRKKLESSKATAPLFDTKLFAFHIEAAYSEMYRRHQLDQPHQSFEVKP